jgi:Cu/Ag efflux protein CusF
MKTVFLAASLALSMTALPPAMAADEQDAHGDHHKAETTATATHAGHGKVNSVDLKAGTINLSHDAIKSLKWPEMTMDFKVHDPALVKDLKPGVEVNFELTKMEGSYRITKISPSAN